jgi:hypothetical protein
LFFFLFVSLSLSFFLCVCAEELTTKKSTISGTYKVNLATTGGLATAILDNAERGYKMEFLDNFPNMINNIPFAKVCFCRGEGYLLSSICSLFPLPYPLILYKREREFVFLLEKALLQLDSFFYFTIHDVFVFLNFLYIF